MYLQKGGGRGLHTTAQSYISIKINCFVAIPVVFFFIRSKLHYVSPSYNSVIFPINKKWRVKISNTYGHNLFTDLIAQSFY